MLDSSTIQNILSKLPPPLNDNAGEIYALINNYKKIVTIMSNENDNNVTMFEDQVTAFLIVAVTKMRKQFKNGKYVANSKINGNFIVNSLKQFLYKLVLNMATPVVLRGFI